MKRFLLPLILLLSLIWAADPAHPQSLTRPSEIGFGFVATHPDGIGESTSAGPGGEIYISYNLSDKFYLSLGTGLYTAMDGNFSKKNFQQTLFPSAELMAGFKILGEENVSPYLFAGVHAFGWKNVAPVTTPVYYDGSIVAGGGLKFKINEKTLFNVSGDYRYVVTSSAAVKPKFWTAKAGISLKLGSQRRRRGEEIEYPVNDSDLALEELFRPDSTGNTGDESQQTLDELFGVNQAGDNKQTTKPTGNKEEQDALALLFSDEQAPATTSVNESEKSPSEYDESGSEIGQLMARIQKLQEDITTRDQEIQSLQNKVVANERAIANLTGGVAGQYAGVGDDFFNNINAANFKQAYQTALQKHYNKKYNEAINEFQMLLQAFPNHPLASNCQYWIGESYNQMGQYQKAIAAFNSVLHYTRSYKLDDALIMNGIIHLKLGNKTMARENFQELISKYPDSEYASKAMRYLGRL